MDGSYSGRSLLTIKDVAVRLAVSISTVRRAIKAGHLKAISVGERQVRIAPADLTSYIGRPLDLDHVSDGETNGSAIAGDVPSGGIERAVASVGAEGLLRGTTSSGLGWSVLKGDARHCAGSVPKGLVDCVVTSPPYYWQRDYEVEGQIGHEASIDGYVQALVDTFEEVKKSLADDGSLFLNLGDTYYSAKGRPHGKDGKHSGRQMMRRHLRAVDGPGLGLPRKSLIGIPWRVAIAMQASGWTLRSAIIWQRPGTLPEPTAHDRPWRTYENIFMFSKGPKYYFNRDALKGEEDIWKIVARPENPGSHFAPYPRELVLRCLDVGCKPGGTVLDPFVGSGTTLVAALEAGRHAIGFELNEKFWRFSAERITREFGAVHEEDV